MKRRIRDAVHGVERLGGRIIEPLAALRPHGLRVIVLDSEGNRIAPHSTADR